MMTSTTSMSCATFSTSNYASPPQIRQMPFITPSPSTDPTTDHGANHQPAFSTNSVEIYPPPMTTTSSDDAGMKLRNKPRMVFDRKSHRPLISLKSKTTVFETFSGQRPSKKSKKIRKSKDNLEDHVENKHDDRWSERRRRNILDLIPKEVQAQYREICFAQWNKNMFPAIQLGPFDIDCENILQQYETMAYKSFDGRKRPPSRLIYWYGIEDLSSAFSFLPERDICSYEDGCEKGYNKVPPAIIKKIGDGKPLTKNEQFHLEGLAEMENQHTLSKEDRVIWLKRRKDEAEVEEHVQSNQSQDLQDHRYANMPQHTLLLTYEHNKATPHTILNRTTTMPCTTFSTASTTTNFSPPSRTRLMPSITPNTSTDTTTDGAIYPLPSSVLVEVDHLPMTTLSTGIKYVKQKDDNERLITDPEKLDEDNFRTMEKFASKQKQQLEDEENRFRRSDMKERLEEEEGEEKKIRQVAEKNALMEADDERRTSTDVEGNAQRTMGDRDKQEAEWKIEQEAEDQACCDAEEAATRLNRDPNLSLAVRLQMREEDTTYQQPDVEGNHRQCGMKKPNKSSSTSYCYEKDGGSLMMILGTGISLIEQAVTRRNISNTTVHHRSARFSNTRNSVGTPTFATDGHPRSRPRTSSSEETIHTDKIVSNTSSFSNAESLQQLELQNKLNEDEVRTLKESGVDKTTVSQFVLLKTKLSSDSKTNADSSSENENRLIYETERRILEATKLEAKMREMERQRKKLVKDQKELNAKVSQIELDIAKQVEEIRELRKAL